MKIQSGRFLFTYVEATHYSDTHNQVSVNNFQCLIWLCWLLHTLSSSYSVDCFRIMFWFGHYQLWQVYLSMEHHSMRNLKHKTLQLPCTYWFIYSIFFKIFFLHLSFIINLLNIEIHAKNIAYFLSSSIFVSLWWPLLPWLFSFDWSCCV